MRILVLIFAAVTLAGCNMISSTTPLFSPADAKGQAQLRPGLWLGEPKDCNVDANQPRAKWPDCATATVVRNDAIFSGDVGAAFSTWKAATFVLARGMPPVLQVGPASGEAVAYVYIGLKPSKFDDRGRIVAFAAWPALCSAPSAPDPNGGTATTPPLIDGLVAAKDGQGCVATSQGPVRVSARESETWAAGSGDGPVSVRWVRDGVD